jgi:hypothetical protein
MEECILRHVHQNPFHAISLCRGKCISIHILCSRTNTPIVLDPCDRLPCSLQLIRHDTIFFSHNETVSATKTISRITLEIKETRHGGEANLSNRTATGHVEQALHFYTR